MKNIALNMFRVLFVAALVLFAADIQAQALRTGYFMDGNIYRYRLNPALQSTRNHVAVPVLGGVQVSAMGNVGVGNFLYDSPYNGDELVTFMHNSVSADEFLGDLEDENIMRMDLDFTLLSVAFNAFGGVNTIDLTVRSNTGMNLPYGMFEFMKKMGNDDYSFSDMKMQTRNFADLSLGHSRKINDALTVGGRVKFLFGLGYADMTFDQMDIHTSGTRWEIAAKGEANIALGGAFKYSDEKTVSGKTVVDGYEDISVGMQGFGMGIDLGATYDLSEVLVDGLTVSASITDLGFISWSGAANAAIAPEDKYVFDGFENMGIHSPENGAQSTTLDDQWSSMRDDLEDFFALEDKGESSVTTGIGAKFNIGAEYKMPFYNKLSAGFLYTHCFDDVFSYNQASLVLSLSPNKVLDFAVSGTVTDYGTGFGAMANIHCPGFGFFIGTDCFLSKVNKQFVPIEDMNASVSFGINVPF
ncbi:MAG: hypothetical protein IJ436_02535 [Bacteroidaceae bacterium]|nr:hypothetical protein [Bacteroidaceae bacterium]